ncbi:MAG TPA: hypothetical protein PKG67_06885, partial [Turneriella sp.]|nr:hypothetical protein [Turneriella sp.]
IVDGSVRKNAPPSKHTLQVLKLASNLSFASSATESRRKLPAAKIRIAGVESEFNGGTLQSLKEHLARYHGKQLSAKIVQVKENESILILDTLAQGEDALLKIEDPDGLLRSLGLLGVSATPEPGGKADEPKKAPPADPAKPAETTEKERWVLNPQQLEPVKGAAPVASEDRRILEVAEGSVGRYRLLAGQNSGDRRLQSVSLAAMARADAPSADDAPDHLTDGIKDNINIKGIELETYNITRTRKKDPMQSGDYGVILRYGEREQSVSLKGKTGAQV